jgi:uncharacterized protein
MRKVGNSLQLSASDLIVYLQCHHLTALDRAVAEGTISKPKIWDDPLLESGRSGFQRKNPASDIHSEALNPQKKDISYVALLPRPPDILQVDRPNRNWRPTSRSLERIPKWGEK